MPATLRAVVLIMAAVAALSLTSATVSAEPYSSDDVKVNKSTTSSGKSVVVQASGFRANSVVRVTIDTTPPVVTSESANGAGKVNAKVVVPAGASGLRTITVAGVAPDGTPKTVSITVSVASNSSASAPRGGSVAPTAVAAGVALPAGAALLVGSRVRRRSRT
jgi:hypothetical protein